MPPPIDRKRLTQLYNAGLTTSQIARRLGCAERSVTRAAGRFGIIEIQTCPRSSDPTPEEIEERARECRERHFAQRRAETDNATEKRNGRLTPPR